MNDKRLNTNLYIKILFILSSMLFAMPSIIYFLQKRTVLNFGPYFQFLYEMPVNRLTQSIIYMIILGLITISYFLIIKKRKVIFKNTKNMFIFLAIIAIIFIAVLPFTCSDVFYYLGIGRLDSKYNQNPYYTTIKQYVEQDNNKRLLENDTVLKQGYINDWSDSTVVYGPVWTLICKVIGFLSFGNLDIGLFIFKIINVLIHLLNCFLIYKISNRKLFSLLYGLNPLVLIEGIACVHNDIFVVLFILLSIFFVRKKKNLVLSTIFLAMATAIKYFAIILLPFIFIYHFRKEKTSKRFLKCLQYGVLFIVALVIPYLFYVRDANVLSGIFIQQEKLAKSFYIIITEYFKDPSISVNTVNHILLVGFAIIYFFTCIVLLNKKQIKFKKEMRTASYFIIAFLFLLITNFQPWYILWIFPFIIYQKKEEIIWIPQMAIMAELANSVFLTYSEAWQNGVPFTFIFIVGSLMLWIISEKRNNRRKRTWEN